MNIVFVTSVKFPFGSASSARTRNIVKILSELNHDVHVIADSISSDLLGYNECTFESLNCDLSSSVTVNDRICSLVGKYHSNKKIDILITNANCKRFNAIAALCKEKGIKLVVENCEWFDPSNYRRGKKDLEYIANQKMICEDFSKADAFISISRLLDEHNRSLGKCSIRIPTILDVVNTDCRIKKNGRDRLKLVYTGRAGKSKEYIGPIIKAIATNKLLSNNVEFHVYGPNYIQLLRNLNYNPWLLLISKKFLYVHGNVEQQKMPAILADADYQIFLRPNRQSSNAGFPTKLGESMAVGTPVITNDTGDIGLYLIDSKNGYILKDYSYQEVQRILLRIIDNGKAVEEDLRVEARKCAEESFDYRIYKESFLRMLERVNES